MLTIFYRIHSAVLLTLSVTLFSPATTHAQEPCGCQQQEAIKICYLATEDYCEPLNGFFSCEYSLDGDFMQFGLSQKLLNAQNFGPAGNSCGIELKKLPPVTGVETMESCDCDIVFVGQYPAISDDFSLDLSNTSVPALTLESIREWSMACESNLVITTQAEANLWGYVTENLNTNPNEPVENVSISIFDGPFGSLDFFLQGGSFQGVFTQIPNSGAEILAEDAFGRPTIVLDNATNDIILADVGILCSGGAGSISDGGAIINNNDILACNLFALGCRIAEGVKFSDALVQKCPGDSILLPGGNYANLPGIYLDTLEAANGCDSVIQTLVENIDQLFTEFSPPLCEGDIFSTTINGTVYDVDNTQGEELLLSQGGCDSIVSVNLFFAPHSFDSIAALQCNGDGFFVDVGGVIYDEFNQSGTEVLTNQYGCDSTVTIDLHFEPADTTLFYYERCAGDTVVLDGITYQAGTTTSIFLPDATSYCDSTIIVDVTAIPLPSVDTDSLISITQGEDFTFDYLIPEGTVVQWSPAEVLSCSQCPYPTLLSSNFPPLFQLVATNEFGCSSSYDIFVQYICNPYIPNAFSPNGDGRNDRFRVYNTCPIEGFEISIFNRWGAIVYQSDDINTGWDGNFKGQTAPIGVYAYAVTLKENGGEKVLSGEVNLLR